MGESVKCMGEQEGGHVSDCVCVSMGWGLLFSSLAPLVLRPVGRDGGERIGPGLTPW